MRFDVGIVKDLKSISVTPWKATKTVWLFCCLLMHKQTAASNFMSKTVKNAEKDYLQLVGGVSSNHRNVDIARVNNEVTRRSSTILVVVIVVVAYIATTLYSPWTCISLWDHPLI